MRTALRAPYFTLQVDLSNAAFADDPVPELIRLLCATVEQLADGDVPSAAGRKTLRDANGNTVGAWRLEVTP